METAVFHFLEKARERDRTTHAATAAMFLEKERESEKHTSSPRWNVLEKSKGRQSTI
jgi:hypothetical protein